MSNIPLDLERRCEQRRAAKLAFVRCIGRAQEHRLERHRQQLAVPRNSKSKRNER